MEKLNQFWNKYLKAFCGNNGRTEYVKKSINSKEHKLLLKLLVQQRLKSGLTQVELAKKLKVPQSFVSKYETGERRLDLIELKEICSILEMSLKEFVERFEKGSK